MSQARKNRINALLGASALGGILGVLGAQPAAAADEKSTTIEEVVVTAARRAQDVTQIPYNITAVGAEQVQRTGASTVEDLSRQIPNLVVTSSGNQFLGAQREIMRGLNASSSNRLGVTLEQSPVSVYLGNAPFANYFQVKDLERVEVLRGPQGTLYGAGSLGGAIRLIPTQPALGKFEGHLTATAGVISHSSDQDYGGDGVVNLPLGDTFALRLGASYDYAAGFIDQFGIFQRNGGGPLGQPVLVNLAAPLTSPAATYSIKDVNWSKTTNLRAAARWKPTEKFDVTLAYNSSMLHGLGPNFDTPAYQGGPDPLSPSVVYPRTGEYEVVQRGLQPYSRHSEMTTLDASYDLGFATLSSTSSYFETRGETYYDGTWGVLGLPPAYVAYYTGSPANPRFNAIQRFDDRDRVVTQEIRLVSNTHGPIDYIVGLFYQKEANKTVWNGFAPGQIAYNNLPGVTVLGFNPVNPSDRIWDVGGTNRFTDKAVFGELTWHASDRLDVAGGVRVFKQTFNRTVNNINPVFGLAETGSNSVDFSDAKYRFNATYEYMAGQRVYFTFSQGFRRGGANSFSLGGFLREPTALLNYVPDSVDNYELGAKGHLPNGWRYSADAFVGKWHDLQIGGFTAVNFWPIVFNGKEAESKGVEFELAGRLSQRLDFQAGYAFTQAELTENFCLPSGDGTGRPSPAGDVACAIQGVKGDTLPSAPRHSGSFTLNYEQPIFAADKLVATLNANYKSSMRQTLPITGQRNPLLPAYWIVNAYAGWDHGPITLAAYVRNVFDKRVVFSQNARITSFAPIDLYETVGHPRAAGIELTYRW